MVDTFESTNSLYDTFSDCSMIDTIVRLERYGSGWSLDIICNMIETQNDEIDSLLRLLEKYGAYDSLVALSILSQVFCNQEIKEWLHKKMLGLPHGEVIYDLADRYPNGKKGTLLYAIEKGDGKWITRCSYVDFEQYVWKNMNQNILKNIRRNSPLNVGIWYPGLYEKNHNEEYMKNLEKYAFPYLISCGEDIQECGNEDNIQTALLREHMENYLAELFLFYFTKVSEVLIPLVEMDAATIAGMDQNEYEIFIKSIYKRETRNELYITNEMIELYEKMLELCIYFGDAQRRAFANDIRIIFPFLYQLVGRENEAVQLLKDTLKYYSYKNARYEEYLLVYYRTILITENETERNHLTSIFDEIYFNKNGMREFIGSARQIKIFYEKLCKDFADSGKRLSPSYNDYSETTEFVKRTWIESGKIIGKMDTLIEKMEKGDTEQKAYAAQDFHSLIYALSSHRNSEIRIEPRRCSEILGVDPPDSISSEVYGFYTKKEKNQICNLIDRMEIAGGQITSLSKQQFYIKLKNKVNSYWEHDKESILCEKLLTAFRGIQSDPYNKWEQNTKGEIIKNRDEDSLNNLAAFFLRAYYGEENIHREEVQGLSNEGKKSGELDVVIYQNGKQFAIQEALKLSSLNRSSLHDHLDRLVNKYDTQGVPVLCLTIYAYNQKGTSFFDKISDYLKGFLNSELFHYELVNAPQRVYVDTADICHHSLSYKKENIEQKLHIFTVLM